MSLFPYFFCRANALKSAVVFGRVAIRYPCRIAALMVLSVAPISRADTPALETVVVSASRGERALKDTTLAITRLDADALASLQLQHPNEFGALVPNAWISRGDGQEHLTAIRSPVLTGPGACGNFLFAEDGIPLRASGFCNVNVLSESFYRSAEAIEISRGPNSSVFGANALFGGLNVVLPDPGVASRLRLDLASDQNAQLDWRISSPDLLSFGSVSADEGWRDDTSVRQQKVGLKTRSTQGEWDILNSLQLHNMEQETAGFIEGKNAYKDRDLARTNANPEAFRDTQSLRAYSRWRRDVGALNLSLTPYLRKNDMAFRMHFVPWKPLERNGHESVGAQVLIAQSDARWRWNAGLDLDYTEAWLEETQEQPAPFSRDSFPLGVHYDYQVDRAAAGAFTEFAYALSNALTFSTNLRWDVLEYDYDNRAGDGSACAPAVATCRFYRPADRRDEFSALSASASLNYLLNAHNRLYLRAGDAFRAPEANELYRLQAESQDRTLENVILRGLELGYGAYWASWQMALSAYAMRQANGIYQDSERNYLTGAETSHRGLEYELRYTAPGDSIVVRFNGAYNRHRYDNAPETLGVTADIEGNDIDTAPRRLQRLSLDWAVSRQWQANVGVSHLGAYYLDPENTFAYGGHTLVDLGLRYQGSARWSLRVTIKNAANRDYAERADVAFGEYRYFPGLGRRIQWQLTWHL